MKPDDSSTATAAPPETHHAVRALAEALAARHAPAPPPETDRQRRIRAALAGFDDEYRGVATRIAAIIAGDPAIVDARGPAPREFPLGAIVVDPGRGDQARLVDGTLDSDGDQHVLYFDAAGDRCTGYVEIARSRPATADEVATFLSRLFRI